ncbi:aryl-alcohol dehydrogenase [Irpex rosettiformis]|uniref:Aryl-alcohol dehydrogenase n=1 Tax=Irpex rosettiformis TaxID=378272 RepID=A0ACB8TNL9_9APHY|nr:aryl-alcohol dehydrogenase [Irpex rosettiformis]
MTSRRVHYVRLGNSGLKVSRLIMGCASFGHKGWNEWVIDDQEEANRMIKFAYDAGIQTFDTANAYSSGLSEIMLGKAIKALNMPREELVIMTKLFAPLGPEHGINIFGSGKTPLDYGIINQWGLNRKHIFDSVKASLKRLQLDYIDVLQCHRLDGDTPKEEIMHALHDVVQAGYVRYIGMSSCYAHQYYAITHGLTPFISMQNHYNLLYREEEREMVPTLKLFGVGMIPWSPLAAGRLAKPLNNAGVTTRSTTDKSPNGYNGPGTPDILLRVEELAKKKGVKMAQIGLAWMLAKDHVTAPIIGSSKFEHLTDAIGALDVKLTEEEIEYLEAPYKPTAIMGHFEARVML